MRLILLAAVVALAAAGPASGQSGGHSDVLEQEIRRLDVAEAEGLLHKDVGGAGEAVGGRFYRQQPA